MEIKTLANSESVIKKLESIRQEVTDKTQNGSTEEMSSNYTAVSRDGDTLEITENKSETKMSDAALANCSKQKLQQLLANEEITRQQYNKAMKNK